DGKIVAGRECQGDVQLNGQKINCDDNGYRVQPNGQTLELLGAACQTLQDEPQSTVTASFACEDLILL
ncbi:MAG TPA: hypothetical protein VI299_01850, partial [Polyangiales bacterium]